MSFLDWTRLNSGFAGVMDTDGVFYPGCDLISDGGRTMLCMAHGVMTGDAAAAMVDTGLDGRVTIGQITCNLGMRIVPGYLESPMNFGIAVMLSQTNILPGSGASGYAVIFDDINFSRSIKLVKMTSGISGGTGGSVFSDYLLLGTSATHIWSPASIVAPYQIQFFWWTDPYFLRGTWLVVNFDGQQLFNLVHTGSDAIVATTSSGEGCFAWGETNAGAAFFENYVLDTFTNITVNGVTYPPP